MQPERSNFYYFMVGSSWYLTTASAKAIRIILMILWFIFIVCGSSIVLGWSFFWILGLDSANFTKYTALFEFARFMSGFTLYLLLQKPFFWFSRKFKEFMATESFIDIAIRKGREISGE